jgi:hypothetical protein
MIVRRSGLPRTEKGDTAPSEHDADRTLLLNAKTEAREPPGVREVRTATRERIGGCPRLAERREITSF